MARKLFVDVELKGTQKAKSGLKGIEKQGLTSTKAISTGFIAATAAVAGLVVGLRGLGRALGSTLTAYNEQEQAEARLVAGLINVGDASDGVIQSLYNQASALQSLTGVSDGLIISAQGMLSSFALTGEEIRELTPRLLDMAAGTAKVGEGFGDVEAISMAMGKALAQGAGALSRYGVVLTDVQRESFNAAEGLDKVRILGEILDANFAGMAAAMGDTYAGEVKKMQEAFGDITEEIGEVLSEGILPLIQGARDLLKQWNDLDEGTKRVNITFGLYVTGAVVLTATVGALVVATRALTGAFGHQLITQAATTVATVKYGGATRAAALAAGDLSITLGLLNVGLWTESKAIERSTAYRLGAITSTHGYTGALKLLNFEIARSIVAQGGLWGITKKLGNATVVSAAAVSSFAFVAGGAYLMALHASEKVTNELRESAKELRKEYEQLRIGTVELEKDTFDLTNEIKRSIKYGRDSADAFDKLKDKVVEYMEANPELQTELGITIGVQGELYDANGLVITSLDQLQTGFNAFSTANMRDELFKAAEAALQTADKQLEAAQASLPWYRMFAHTAGWGEYNELQVMAELKAGREKLAHAIGGLGGLGGAPIIGGLTGDIYGNIEKPLETEQGREQFREFWTALDPFLKSKIGMEKGFRAEEFLREEKISDEAVNFLEMVMGQQGLTPLWEEFYKAPGFGGPPGVDRKPGPTGNKGDPIIIEFDKDKNITSLLEGFFDVEKHKRIPSVPWEPPSFYGYDPLSLAPEFGGGPPGPFAGFTPGKDRAGIRQMLALQAGKDRMSCEAQGGTWNEETQECKIGQPDKQIWATAATQAYKGQYGQAAGGLATALFTPTLGPFAGLAGMIVGDIFGGLFDKKQKPQAMKPIPVEIVNWDPFVQLLNVTLSSLVRGSGRGVTGLNKMRLTQAQVGI